MGGEGGGGVGGAGRGGGGFDVWSGRGVGGGALRPSAKAWARRKPSLPSKGSTRPWARPSPRINRRAGRRLRVTMGAF